MRAIAIYDMDKTITRAATWTPFLRAALAAGTHWRWLLLPFAGVALAGYTLRLYGRGRLKELTQALLVGRRVADGRLAAAAAGFAAGVVETGVLAPALARIAADRAEGRMLVMATASYRFYAADIARRLGFDAVIATDLVRDPAGRVLARIDGENCYGPGKLRMIQHWLAGQGLAREAVHVRFYSDHVSDAPVFDWADEAMPVNAHKPLRRLAARRGWQVLDWRRPG